MGGNMNGSGRHVLLISYSADVSKRLAASLQLEGADVSVVDGRDPNAVEAVRKDSASVVVLDCSARDVNVSQAIRHLGRMLPRTMVLAIGPDHHAVGVFQDGHKVCEAEDLKAALSMKP